MSFSTLASGSSSNGGGGARSEPAVFFDCEAQQPVERYGRAIMALQTARLDGQHLMNELDAKKQQLQALEAKLETVEAELETVEAMLETVKTKLANENCYTCVLGVFSFVLLSFTVLTVMMSSK